MQIKWRKYDLYFTLITYAFFLIGLIVEPISGWSAEANSMKIQFSELNLVFEPFPFYVLPKFLQISSIVLIVLLGHFILFGTDGKKFRSIKAVTLLIVCFIVSALINTESYWLSHAYQLKIENYGGSSLQQRSLNFGMMFGLVTVFLLTVYYSVREIVIRAILLADHQKDFKIVLLNRIVLGLYAYLGIFFFFASLGVLRSDGAAIFFVCFLAPLIICVYFNTFYLFPRFEASKNLGFWKKLLRQLILPTALTIFVGIPFIAIDSHLAGPVISLLWLFLVVASPLVSLVAYQFYKKQLSEILDLKESLSTTTASLQYLQAQVNPHFLFNALNNLYGASIQENAPLTGEGLLNLSNMMRYLLDQQRNKYILLKDEVDFIKSYVNFEKKRWEGNHLIKIELDISAEHLHQQISPMLIVPFIENAFKHGLSLEQEVYIKISIHTTTDSVYVEVTNPILEKSHSDPEKNSHGIGINNVRERLELLYPKQHELIIHSINQQFIVRLLIKTV
ncbi:MULTISPECIES: sensor histidine kinase [unclassified Paraflavitalea]|uniref:sensor histidine kinase n=1 Tax=unclassified Paraflavitalea TaxID=2798305 RepID=UPI003D33FB47